MGQAVVDQGIAALGGNAGALYLLSAAGDQLDLTAFAGYPPAIVDPWRTVALTEALPLTEAIQDRQPVFRGRDEMISRFGVHPLLEQTDVLAAVPVMLEGRPLGAMVVSFPPGADIDEEDRTFAETLANYCAQSLQRARLLDAEQEARADLASRERALREILDRVAAMVVTADPAADPPGSRTYYNRRWREYTGLSHEDLMQRGWLQLVHPDDQAALWTKYEEGLASGKPQSAIGRLRRADGEYRWHLARVETVRDEEGSIRDWIITLIDVDDLKRTQETLEEVIHEKDAFVGLLSHEVRAPLAAIYGAAEVLLRRDDALSAGDRRQLLRDIVEESQRLHRLVENMLVLAHEQSGAGVGTEPVLIRHLATRLADEHHEQFPHRTVVVSAGGEDIPVIAEPTYVEQILRNLLTNAEKYSPAAEVIEIELAVEGSALTVSVLDRGPGLSEEDAKHVFQPFYRASGTARMVAGTGIGLAVCRTLAEAQGGTVGWRPRPGGGSEFAFSLPLDPSVPGSGGPAD